MAKRYWPCTSSIPRRKLSMLPAPGRRMRRSRRSRSWTSFSSPWARAWDGHEVVPERLGTPRRGVGGTRRSKRMPKAEDEAILLLARVGAKDAGPVDADDPERQDI